MNAWITRVLRTKRIAVVCVVCVAAVAAIAVFGLFQAETKEAIEVKKVHIDAYLMARELKSYLRHTGHFPSSLEAAAFEGQLERHYLSPPQGCSAVYTEPLSNAPGITAVYVVSNAVSRAVVSKDFQISYNP